VRCSSAAQITAIFSGARWWAIGRMIERLKVRGGQASAGDFVGAAIAVERWPGAGGILYCGRLGARNLQRKIYRIHRGRDSDRDRHLRLHRLHPPADRRSRLRHFPRAARARGPGGREAAGDAVLSRLRPDVGGLTRRGRAKSRTFGPSAIPTRRDFSPTIRPATLRGCGWWEFSRMRSARTEIFTASYREPRDRRRTSCSRSWCTLICGAAGPRDGVHRDAGWSR